MSDKFFIMAKYNRIILILILKGMGWIARVSLIKHISITE